MKQNAGTASEAEHAQLQARTKYAMDHFKYLADQRMKTFNYYAIVVAATITGSITVLDRCTWAVITAMGVVQIVIASIFFIVEIRNSNLVFCARRALIECERALKLEPPVCVIRCDDRKDPELRQYTDGLRSDWGKRHRFRKFVDDLLPEGATFTVAFNAAFTLQICAGVGLIVAAIWLKGPLASPAH
ncbi:MAG: hypothetical protein RIT24_2035 [Planctomycetota bacterium]|jgi:hypothetical protein